MSRYKKLTPFGWQVSRRLEKRGLTISDLAEAVERMTGKFVTDHYILNALRGMPTPRRVLNAIREVLDLPEEG